MEPSSCEGPEINLFQVSHSPAKTADVVAADSRQGEMGRESPIVAGAAERLQRVFYGGMQSFQAGRADTCEKHFGVARVRKEVEAGDIDLQVGR
jgi:hypothetical protein